MAKEFNFTVKHTVKRQRVVDVIQSLTTTYSPWIAEVNWSKNTRDYFHLIAKFQREQDDEGIYKGRKVITQRAVEKGLAAMSKECAFRFGNVMNDEYDAIDADIFMQCVVFGKVIYG